MECTDVNGNQLVVGNWYLTKDKFYLGKFEDLIGARFIGDYYYSRHDNNVFAGENIKASSKDYMCSVQDGDLIPATIEDLKKIIPKGDFNYPEEGLDPRNNLVKGRWYFNGIKAEGTSHAYYLGKFDYIDDTKFYATEYYSYDIGLKKYTGPLKNTWTTAYWKDNLRLATQQELDDILPVGHADRSNNKLPPPKFKVGDIVDIGGANMLSLGGEATSYPLQSVFVLDCKSYQTADKIIRVFYNAFHQRYWYETERNGTNHVLESDHIVFHQPVYYPDIDTIVRLHKVPASNKVPIQVDEEVNLHLPKHEKITLPRIKINLNQLKIFNNVNL